MNSLLARWSLPVLFFGWFAVSIFDWGARHAVFSGDVGACTNEGAGACWTFVVNQLDFLMFGFYPTDQYYRCIIVMLLHAAALMAMLNVKSIRTSLLRSYFALFIAFVLSVIILRGDGFFLEVVPSRLWTGFTLTLVLGSGCITLGLAVGIVLALCRTFGGTLISTLSTMLIELLRSLPGIVTMFGVVVLSPYFLPEVIGESIFSRVMFGFVLFAAAYYAEAIRGALITFDEGQIAAAHSLGLKTRTIYLQIVVPQAVSISFPSLMNVNLMVYRDTVLVLALGYYELLGAANASLGSHEWRGFAIEAFIFVYLVFLVSCSLIAWAGQTIEQNLYLRKV